MSQLETPENKAPERLPPFAAGDVVGKLTLLREVGRDKRGAIWECECECGNVVVRKSHPMRTAQTKGSESMCPDCLREAFRQRVKGGIEGRRLALKNELFRRQWDATGSLYSDRGLDFITYEIREDSDIPEPVDIPEAPYIIDSHYEDEPWPLFDDAVEPMTLEEIAGTMGITRERVRQIEAIALRKLRRTLDKLEAEGDFKMAVEWRRKWGFLPTHPAPLKPKQLPPDVESEPVIEESPEPETPMNPNWKKDALNIPDGGMLAKSAAASLGCSTATFHNRTAGMTPAGYVEGWAGKPWAYWSPAQVEELREKFKDRPVRTRNRLGGLVPAAAARRVIEVSEPPVIDGSDAFPALLVVKAKVSGIPMTIPVTVQQMARMEDGNHQVRVKFPGGRGDSILPSIIVWAKDLLTTDYSPFKTPWDD